MSSVRDILGSVQDTEGAISRLEQLVQEHPEDQALRLNLGSLVKRKGDLLEQLQEESYADQVDLCDYRIVADNTVSVPAVGRSLQSFQEIVTAIYDAIVNAPKQRYRPSADVLAQSSLDFGFSYRGSLGFVMTIPNERLLAIQSELDETVSKTMELISSNTPDQIASLAETVGIAAVSKAHAWAKIHSQYALTTDIKWWKGKEVFSQLLRQPPDIDALRAAIELTSEDTVDPIRMSGRLVGLDVETDLFHLMPEDGGDIRGRLSDELKAEGPWEVPGYYDVELVRASRIHFSTGEEDVIWTLTSIQVKMTDMH